MTRTPLRILIATLCLAAGPLSAVAQEIPRIAFVDYTRIQRMYYRTYEERQAFEEHRLEEMKKVEEPRKRLESLLKEQEKLVDELKDPGFSEDRKKSLMTTGEQRRGQILSLQRETLELERKIEAGLSQRAEETQRSLTEEIYNKIGEIAKAKDLDLVLNRTFGMMGVPTVAYSSTDRLNDLTDEVVKALNANAPDGWVPPQDGEALQP